MTLFSEPSICSRVSDFTKPSAVSTRLLAAAKLASSIGGRAGGATPARRPPVFMAKSADWRIWRARQNMSGYSRSCRRADSSILLAAQCAAALSMMPASAPSCWMQGVTAASYNEYDIWASPKGGILWVETIGGSQFACQQFTEAGILGELITTPLSKQHW